jgi:hypothetical protein
MLPVFAEGIPSGQDRCNSQMDGFTNNRPQFLYINRPFKFRPANLYD